MRETLISSGKEEKKDFQTLRGTGSSKESN